MHIKKISIFGLFGMFNHEIPLNQAEHITILHGMNGMGKTTVFKIIDAFFKGNVSDLNKLPFQKCKIEMNDSKVFQIKKNDKLLLSIYQDDEEIYVYNPKDKSKESDIRKLIRMLPNIEKVGVDRYMNLVTGEILSLEEIKLKEFPFFKSDSSNIYSNSKAFQQIGKSTKTYLIETQRLISFRNSNKTRNQRHFLGNPETETKIKESIIEFSEDFGQELLETKRKSDTLSNDLRLTLGERVASGEINTGYTEEELIAEITKINEKVEQLKSVGLLEKTFKGYSWRTDNANPLQRAIFSANIQDTQKILDVFDGLYEKLALFLEILNERRLTFKQISVEVSKGFIFTNENGEILKPTQLSSGEQHEIILLYLLLFKIPPNSLIMIDEPEISLHIDWQHEFIQDMEEIIKLRGFDVMLATHSPDIVNGRSELTVSLNKNEIEPYSN